jgi:hypothetical protein
MKNLDEDFVRKAVISFLSKKGYDRKLQEKQLEEHGVDIKVRHFRYPRYFLVECKGEPQENVKHPHSRREVSFIQVLGQIVSRMNYKAKYKYGVGLPETYKKKVLTRLSSLLLKKLNLYVFLVSSNKKVIEINWKNFDDFKELLD